MKKLAFVGALVVAAAVASSDTTQDPLYALTAIDSRPSPQQIDCAFNVPAGSDCPTQIPPGWESSALLQLRTAATDAGTDANTYSKRLRALHALVDYCVMPCSDSDPAHTTLKTVLQTTAQARAGSDLLILRATIESLGLMQVSTDEPTLEPFLSHASRDIRAATARALGKLCNTSAVQPLRDRYQQEPTDQVRLAISDALGALATCTPP